MSEVVIQEEEAQRQIDLLNSVYDIDPDFFVVGGESVKQGLRSLKRHIMCGRLEVTEKDGSIAVVQHIRQSKVDVKSVTYKALNMKAKMEADKGKGQTERIIFLLGSLSGCGPATIEKFILLDATTAETVANYFLLA